MPSLLLSPTPLFTAGSTLESGGYRLCIHPVDAAKRKQLPPPPPPPSEGSKTVQVRIRMASTQALSRWYLFPSGEKHVCQSFVERRLRLFCPTFNWVNKQKQRPPPTRPENTISNVIPVRTAAQDTSASADYSSSACSADKKRNKKG